MVNSDVAGYCAALVAVMFFGSNFVPIKNVKTGDGVFFQFFMCNAIFMTSLPVLLMQGATFHGLAMIGGALWCTGNMMCGPVIQLLGLGMGLLIWGSANMLMGWASGTFGLFGLHREDISNPGLNFGGVSLALIGLVVFLQVKSQGAEDNHSADDKAPIVDKKIITPLLFDDDYFANASSISSADVSKGAQREAEIAEIDPDVFGSGWSVNRRRIVGLVMACCAGILFGCSFDPAQYVIDNKYDGEDNTLNYVFPHFCGIILASWSYTLIYCCIKLYKKQEIFMNPECFVPATVSGLMWGIAEIAWFIANNNLGFSVSFPIITSGPGFIGSLWGVLVFKEIQGTRNLTMLSLAFVITIPGLIMVALSR